MSSTASNQRRWWWSTGEAARCRSPFPSCNKPGAVSANASGRGQGAILNANFGSDSSTNPVAKGGIVLLFGTGEGPIDPPGVTGRVNSAVFPHPAAHHGHHRRTERPRARRSGAGAGGWSVPGIDVEVPQGVARATRR